MSVVKRAKGRWDVVVEEGRHPARHCAGVPAPTAKDPDRVRRHRVWTDEHRGETCPTCGAPLGPVTKERRQRWHTGFPTKAAATEADARLSTAKADGIYRPPTSITVREFFEERWLPAVVEQYRPTTLAGYRANITNHVVPGLGGMQLRALGPEHLNKLYADLLAGGRVKRQGQARGEATGKDRAGGLSPRTVASIHKLVHRALRDAVRWRLIARNTADDANPPDPGRAVTQWWTADQLRTFVEHDPDDRLDALWTLVATTGMRRGELCGLRWSDVDLDAARLSVAQTITAARYEAHVGEPKTASSRRVIPLGDRTVAALRAHATRQKRERLAVGEAWVESGLVFTDELGAPMHPQSITYLFTKRAAAAALPTIRLHDVRHSYASAALAAGEHPKAVQERLGHSSSSITLDLYSHVTEGVARETAARTEAHILG